MRWPRKVDRNRTQLRKVRRHASSERNMAADAAAAAAGSDPGSAGRPGAGATYAWGDEKACRIGRSRNVRRARGKKRAKR